MSQQASATRQYEDFQPSSKWERDEGSDTFVVNLPGFKRDQLRIRIEGHGALKVTGERPLIDNKWSRFRKDFLIPNNCDENEIKAKFVDGVLQITMPKPITKVAAKDESMPKPQSVPNQETEIGKKSDKVNGDVKGEKQGGNDNQGQKETEDAKKEMIVKDGKVEGEGGKMVGSKENQVLEPPKQTSSNRISMGMGMSFRFKQPRRASVSIAVAIAAVVALGVYAKYRLKDSVKSET